MAAFHDASVGESEHDDGGFGALDSIYDDDDDDDDFSRNPILPAKVDAQELQRQEQLEEAPAPQDLMELEATRRIKWLRIPGKTRLPFDDFIT